jgi:hypothetical protein
VYLEHEHPGESSATTPIWESRGISTAKFGSFELMLLVLLPRRAAGSARCTLITGM